MAANYKAVVKRRSDDVVTADLTKGYVRKRYAESMKERWKGFNPNLVETHYVVLLVDNVLEEAVEQLRNKQCTT